MPYKDPERKRQWEREHRKQRNAQRRVKRLEGTTFSGVRNPAPGPTPQAKSGWKSLIALAIGLGVIVLGAIAGSSAALPANLHGPCQAPLYRPDVIW